MEPREASFFDHDCCRPFLFEGGDTGVLLIHGFTGSVAHMRPLGDALADRGYTVMGINLPGHATTEADMALSGWRQWQLATQKAMEELRHRCQTVAVAGLSMGGLLALLLAEDGKADACVTISTPMATQNKLLALASVLAFIQPRISWAPPEERHKLLNSEFDYGYSGFPTRKAADLNRLIHMARSSLNKVRCPVLSVQSTGDETIWPGSADCILTGSSSEIKQKLVLQRVPHVCTISTELPAIVSAMDVFLKTLYA